MTIPIQHDRLAQLLMKSDPSLALDAARVQLERASIVITSDEAAVTPWGQAALLTITECAKRSFRGGVFLKSELEMPVCVGNWMPIPLRRMLVRAGVRLEAAPEQAIHIHVGSRGSSTGPCIHCWTDGWLGITSPTSPSTVPMTGNEISGALAGAMAVTEAFRQGVQGDLIAGKRTQRLSPLDPGNPSPDGITLELFPAAMWLVGLGNLGQALLWVMGLLPYNDPGAVSLVLQDMDTSGPENQGIQVLTDGNWIHNKKARSAAHWSEARGFSTTVNELPFTASTVRDLKLPGLAFVGVDNLRARKDVARLESGFDLVLDAGLGGTPNELFDVRLHGFPGSRTPENAWPDEMTAPSNDVPFGANFAKLIAQGRLDRCGATTIAGQSVGIPSTAVAAATIQIAQACRAIASRTISDLIDVSLSNVGRTHAHNIDFGNARAIIFEERRRPIR